MCIPFKANGVLKSKTEDSDSEKEESKSQKAASG